MAKQSGESPDAVKLLKSEHDKAKKAFKKYQELGQRAYVAKKKLALEICEDLMRHATVEEEIFYPAFRKHVKKSEGMANEAKVEHESVEELIAKIRNMESRDDLFDAYLHVLNEYVDHHVREEEKEMFPAMGKSDVDLRELGGRITERNRELS